MNKSFLVFWLVITHLGHVFASSDTASTHVQILALNDFHGNLEAPEGSGGKIEGVDAGGAEYLASHLQSLRAGHPYSITVSAGDLFGASPLLSALFHDRPTIEAMNLMGLELNAVGNHEFDKGWHELLHLVQGNQNFAGADFAFLSANVMVDETKKTLFKSYDIRQFGSIKIGFIGVVLKDIDHVVSHHAIQGLSFFDEADAVNAAVLDLKKQKVETIVVLIHEGGHPTGGYNECPGISGPIVSLAQRMSDDVSVILSGHTHKAYNCKIANKLVTSAASNGRLVTAIDLVVDNNTGKMLQAKADNVIVTRTIRKDPEQTALINKYKQQIAPIANSVIGKVTRDITKLANTAGESLLGRMLADAHLEAGNKPEFNHAQIAFVNPGGMRADITYKSSVACEGDGNITYSEAYSVQPFGNNLIIMTLTGWQIFDILQQQFTANNAAQKKILQVSKGFSYSLRERAAPEGAIDVVDVKLNNVLINAQDHYRVVANSFLADGGDGFFAFKHGVDRIIGDLDIAAIKEYLSNHSPISGDDDARITRVP